MGISPENLVLVQESAYGVPVLTSGAVDYTLASTYVVPLVESNAFSADMTGGFQEIPWGGGYDEAADEVVDQWTCSGTLSTLGYPGLAAFLLNAAVTRVNAAQTLPWPTTLPQYDLASFTAYHAIRRHDGTVKRRKLVGGKVTDLTLACSRDQPKMTIQCSLMFQKEVGNAVDSSADVTPTEFPLPPDAAYPKGPYLFSQSAGGVYYNSAVLAQYQDVSLKVTNKLDPRWFESRFLYSMGAFGRDATADVGLLYKGSPDLRAAYQSAADRQMSFQWGNGVNTLKLDFGNANYLTAATYDLPLGQEKMQKISVKNKYDRTVSLDLVVTNT